MTVYVTKAEFTRQKTRLTRAQKTRNPVVVLDAVERTYDEWAGKAWPDDWARWARAVEDAFYAWLRLGREDCEGSTEQDEIEARFRRVIERAL